MGSHELRALALLLAILPCVLSASHLGGWLLDTYNVVLLNQTSVLDIDVVATILLRFSLSLGKPWNVTLAVLAVLFGMIVAVTFRYCSWLDQSRTEQSVVTTAPDPS